MDKPKDPRVRLQSLFRRAQQALARHAAADVRANMALWPARAPSQSFERYRSKGAAEDVRWVAFDRKWLSPCFFVFSILSAVQIVNLLVLAVVGVLLLEVLSSTHAVQSTLSILSVVFLAFLVGSLWASSKISSWSGQLTAAERDLRGLIRLAWITRHRQQDFELGYQVLFGSYLRNPLGDWFIRQTYRRMQGDEAER